MKPRGSLLIAALALTGGVLAAQTITISPDGKSTTLVSATSDGKIAVRLNQTLRTSPVVLDKASTRLTTRVDAMKSSAATSAAPTSGLLPGQAVFVGSTGATRMVAAARPIGNAADVVVVSASGTGVSAATALSANPLAASIERQVFQGDLLRDLGGPGLLPGTRTAVNADFVIGQNGFPVPITTAAAATSGPAPGTVIGPNGFPVPVAQAQAASPVIGPNGFPTTATPVIGTNGFPTTATGAFAQTGLTRGVTTIPTAVSQGGASAGGVSTPAAATTVTTTTVSTGPAIGSTAGATTSGVGGASPQ